jgi:hypothetical protein
MIGSGLLAGLPLLLSGGCPGFTITGPGGSFTLPGIGVVTIEVVNDTPYDVEPEIVFDDDPGLFAGLVPSEDLAVGTLRPGEARRLNIDCDQIGLVRSEEARQFVGPFRYTAPDSATLERDDEFDCGDVIQFQYIGEGDSFGVVVAVNGIVVD